MSHVMLNFMRDVCTLSYLNERIARDIVGSFTNIGKVCSISMIALAGVG